MAANRRKVLVPLATLMVAGSVAVGSGATFTSTTASTTAVSSGVVSHSNDVTSLNITNIKHGDTVTGAVTITNTGSLPSTLTIAQTSASSSFVTGDLKLRLTSGTATDITNNFGAFSTTPVALGSLAADPDGAGPAKGGSITVNFEVKLTETTDNTNESKTATAAFQWVSTQEAGSALSFVPGFDALVGVGQ